MNPIMFCAKIVKRSIVKAIKTCRWLKQARICRHGSINLPEENLFLPQDKKILICAPHADDETIGCFEIMKDEKLDVSIYYAGLVGDQNSENIYSIRLKEIEKMSKLFKRKLYYDAKGDLTCLKSIISNYDIIFIPPYIDWHSEHRMINKIVLSLIDNQRQIVYLYNVSVPLPPRYINCYRQITKEKWKHFRDVYVSQMFMPIKRFQLLSKSFFRKTKKPIEAYHRLNDDECALLKTINYDANVLNQLKCDIDNLVVIRKKASDLYAELFGVRNGYDR